MKLTRATFVSYIYAALIALTFGWPLIWAAGAYGAVLGMILTSLIADLFFWRAYRRELPPRGDSS